MSTATINIRMDTDLKTQAQSILTDLGMDMSTAVKAFLKQIVYRQAIPFEISKRNVPVQNIPAPNTPARKQAKLGGWEGKIFMAEDFNEPMEEFAEYM